MGVLLGADEAWTLAPSLINPPGRPPQADDASTHSAQADDLVGGPPSASGASCRIRMRRRARPGTISRDVVL